ARVRGAPPAMQTLSVQLGTRAYPILIGSGAARSPELLARHVPQSDVLLVTNSIVAPLYGEALEQALVRPGRRVLRVTLPDGEHYKTLETAARVFDVLVANRFGRD